jgi:hypothetical protein
VFSGKAGVEKLNLKRLMAAFVKMRPRLEAAALARVRSAATAEDLVQARNASKKLLSVCSAEPWPPMHPELKQPGYHPIRVAKGT